MNYYSQEELKQFNFKTLGEDVKISRKASIYNPEEMEFASHIRIDDFCILSGKVKIGNYVHIAAYTSLHGSFGIIFEDFSTISVHSVVFSSSDDYLGCGMTNPTIPDQFKNVDNAPVFIGRHTIIGAHSVVLPGVKLLEGSSFGAFSLIAKDSEEWSVNVGIPAQRIQARNRDVLEVEKEFKEYVKCQNR